MHGSNVFLTLIDINELFCNLSKLRKNNFSQIMSAKQTDRKAVL